MEEKQRQQEVGRIFQWFAENPSVVEDIRSEDGVMDAKNAVKVLEKLQADRMEYLIPIFLTNIYNDRVMSKVIKRFFSELLVKSIDSEGLEKSVSRLIEIAKEETL